MFFLGRTFAEKLQSNVSKMKDVLCFAFLLE